MMGEMNTRPDVDVEALCSPDYKWVDSADYKSWPGLYPLSHRIPAIRKSRFLAAQYINPRRAIAHAIEQKADIIHFANINHLSFPFWKKELEQSGIRTAVSAHDVRRQKAIVSRTWEDAQLQAFYRFADAIFVHSTYQERELFDFAHVDRERIHVVPHGLYAHGHVDVDRDRKRERLGLPANRQVALFFGQIRDEKNLASLIRSMALSESSPHLLVAGRGGGRHKDLAHYESVARDVGVADHVTFIDRYIEDKEAALLFAISDWVALPYDNSFTSQSGVLNVAAEYERPVLVSSAPVLSETVRKCNIGIACAGVTPAALAEGIDVMCKRIKDGHQHAFDEYRGRYSWEENVNISLDVYRSLLGE